MRDLGMVQTAVRVCGVSKKYSAVNQRHDTLREAITSHVSSFFARRDAAKEQEESFWALRDVSFEIKRGEVVGIIGRNGAGKSTLLKILSRITEPTQGSAEITGRLSALLEVGTGFDRELSGRDNVYLSGAILGMKKAEIDQKFDDIVAFAEVQRFIDVPVKHYSSGMYVRLAFSIAAHLDPDVLVVDEVLAVGDLEFQRKCLGRLGSAAGAGRTVLIVSHNMSAIDRLCDRAILLDKGAIVFDGSAAEAVRRYESTAESLAEWRRPDTLPADGDCVFSRVAILGEASREAGTTYRGDEPICVEIEYSVRRPLDPCLVGARIFTAAGEYIFGTEDVDGNETANTARAAGSYRAHFAIPGHLLRPGRYTLMVGAHSPHRKWYELVEQAAVFDVLPTGSLATDGRNGAVCPLIKWQTEMVEAL
jgi:lipopolysaccharide transport system ATP-binding protein